MTLKLFLISQRENNDYDTYDSAVVAAPDEDTARNTKPRTGEQMTAEDWRCRYSDWCSSPAAVTVVYLGDAAPGVTPGIVCASYNAG